MILVWTVWMISGAGVNCADDQWCWCELSDAGVNCVGDQWGWCDLNDADVNCVDDGWCWCELCWWSVIVVWTQWCWCELCGWSVMLVWTVLTELFLHRSCFCKKPLTHIHVNNLNDPVGLPSLIYVVSFWWGYLPISVEWRFAYPCLFRNWVTHYQARMILYAEKIKLLLEYEQW